jgi:hypothetical protein
VRTAIRRPRGSSAGARTARGTGTASRALMLDVLFLLATVAFFALSIAYVAGCDRL